VLEDGAGDGKALLLAAGEADAALADFGVVALGQLFDHVVDLGDLRGLHHVGEAGVGVGGDEVLVEGAREEVGFLRNYGEVLPELVGAEINRL
jgi:hypothetical protein